MQRKTISLETYVTRYRHDMRLLNEHPEKKDLLKRRIKEHEKNIIECVTSDEFQEQFRRLNL